MNAGTQRKLGGILGYLYTILHSVISIIYIPLLLNGIGDGEYGLYQIMGSVIAYFSIMESPLSSSVLRYYSYYKECGDQENMENTLAIGRRIFRVLSLILAMAIIPCICIVKLCYSDALSVHELTEAYYMIVVMVINSIVSANSYIYIASINANEKFVFLKLTNIALTLIQPISVI